MKFQTQPHLIIITVLQPDSQTRLFLIPTPIFRQKENETLPRYTVEKIREIRCFIVEKSQTALSFLQWIGHPVPIHEMTFRVLNKKTPDHEVYSYLKLLKEQDTGILSEAGAPGVADPGARLVSLAHENNIEVVPLTGPSSILLALMGAGLNGQSFAFHGYLPINKSQRQSTIQTLQAESARKKQTQIVMETPHRNADLFRDLLSQLHPAAKLCVASNLTSPEEYLKTKSVDQWKTSEEPDFNRKPTLFLFLSS